MPLCFHVKATLLPWKYKLFVQEPSQLARCQAEEYLCWSTFHSGSFILRKMCQMEVSEVNKTYLFILCYVQPTYMEPFFEKRSTAIWESSEVGGVTYYLNMN
jgi:hypothetical protein